MKSAAEQRKNAAAPEANAKAPSKELEFRVTVEEANNIVGALAELPAKVSMALIGKLQQQAALQLRETPP